ncbi:MAG: glycogen debranching protein GlgX [Candidatus Krumholzibacteriia bacterium]
MTPRTDAPLVTATSPGAGRPAPLGATVTPHGVNFSVYAPAAATVELCLFANADDPQPQRVLPLAASYHHTGGYWHVLVPGAGPGQVYGYRVQPGEDDPLPGPAHDGKKLLLDPYARVVTGLDRYRRTAATLRGDNTAEAMRGVVAADDDFAWEEDGPLPPISERPLTYELHVGGFTADPSSGVAAERRGTYAGLVEKIPYLQALGVTAVELLPVQQFDPQQTPAGLPNYWGYSPVAFLAPHALYSSDRSPLGPRREFREMVQALHRAGIRVILDVVFNHTAEGGRHGAVLSLRGFADREYYLRSADGRQYVDYTGCGNTFAAAGPAGLRLIVDALRAWVRDYHVDGFRFDLASALTRDITGVPRRDTAVIWAVDTEPELAGAELIAEAWDLGGLYQVGGFPGRRFAHWNDRFRDDGRRFWRGDNDTIESLMARIVGSPDIYAAAHFKPWRSVNLVTCHDGFTLEDLVTYNRKHNEANGEANRDGSAHNWSWNCGVEGPSDAPDVQRVRSKQVRNFLVLLMMAHGQPLLAMGDEVRRTQGGNNNAYCQDNPISWFDWTALERHADLLRFTRELIAFSRRVRVLGDDRYWTVTSPRSRGVLSWHGVWPGRPDWRTGSHSLAFTLDAPDHTQSTYLALNAWWRPLDFRVPRPRSGAGWRRVVDTALPPPADFTSFEEGRPMVTRRYHLQPHSALILHSE